MVWLGTSPVVTLSSKTKKGMQWEMATLAFQGKKTAFSITVDKAQGEWLVELLQKIAVTNAELLTFQAVKADYEAAGLDEFEPFWYGKQVSILTKNGLLAM
jgi:hypothetical protein